MTIETYDLRDREYFTEVTDKHGNFLGVVSTYATNSNKPSSEIIHVLNTKASRYGKKTGNIFCILKGKRKEAAQ